MPSCSSPGLATLIQSSVGGGGGDGALLGAFAAEGGGRADGDSDGGVGGTA